MAPSGPWSNNDAPCCRLASRRCRGVSMEATSSNCTLPTPRRWHVAWSPTTQRNWRECSGARRRTFLPSCAGPSCTPTTWSPSSDLRVGNSHAARVHVHESHLAMALGWHHDHALGGARGSAPEGVIMGFLQPNLPVVDMDEWSKGTRAERVRSMARHLAEAGFGAPDVVYLAYVLKIGLYVV